MAEILIIGGGVSGLSAGIYAQMQGHNATICEKSSVAGGNLTGWDRNGYHIDNCIHWLTGTNPNAGLYKMWQELGAFKKEDIIQGDTLYTCKNGEKFLSLYRDLYRLQRDMLSISPRDRDEIRELILAIDIMQRLNRIGGVNHDEGLSASQLSVAATLMRKYYSLSTDELAHRFTHPLLRSFITAFWGGHFGALALIMVFAHFCGENGGIPRGGSCEMAKNMVKRFENLGGTLLLNKEATKINHTSGYAHSVSFSDGTVLTSDYVVVSTDPIITFNKLLNLPMPRAFTKMYEDKRLLRFSSYQCAFSCDANALDFKGDYIFTPYEKYKHLVPTGHIMLREFSHEPSFAPKGKCVLQSLIFCYEDDAKHFIDLKKKDPCGYKAKKQELNRIITEMIIKELPSLAPSLTLIDSWTPATYNRYVASSIGSYMSFTMPKGYLPTRVSGKIKDIKNVILATQWQQAPGGLPIAAKCGKKAVDTISSLEKSRIKA